MPDTPSNATGTYGEGVKWILAIAAAAIAGAFLHLKEVEEQNIFVQILLAFSLIAFVVSIWMGMNYLLWLNMVPVARDRRKEYQDELTRLQTIVAQEPAREPELKDRIAKLPALAAEQGKKIEDSEVAMPPWHKGYTYSFTGALACATVAVLLSLILNSVYPKKEDTKKAVDTAPAAPVKLPFSLVTSAVHLTNKGREAHTFLINSETGDLWQMECDKNGLVAFHKVARMDAPPAK